MNKLLNKSFFKFLFGFLAILALSLSIIMGARIYEGQQSESGSSADCLDGSGGDSSNC